MHEEDEAALAPTAADVDAVRERYARFARDEAPGRSDLYADWARGVAGDPEAQRTLARIPPQRRQPPLVFAVTRLLGAPEEPYSTWAGWLAGNADAVVAECARRSIQTNEPLRCAALLPALSLIEGPIALLEVGASAGLCLYPDRYAYRYTAPNGAQVRLDPVIPAGEPMGATPTMNVAGRADAAADAAVVLECALRTDVLPPARLPDVVWRAGIDLAPLDPRSDETAAWLTGLVWPGETGRAERVRAALRIAAADPPLLRRGDGATTLAEVAAQAPPDATLVITTPGVLAHIPRAGREQVIDQAQRLGRWVTIDDPGLHRGWTHPIDLATWPSGGFAVALDGEVLAAADPLGGWLEWRRR